MADPRDEAYILEKKEISEDEDDGFDYQSLEHSQHESDEEGDDLNNFEVLKMKTTAKMQMTHAGETIKSSVKAQAQPKVINREEVIDDFIRNFLAKFGLSKTLNQFQQEWNEL